MYECTRLLRAAGARSGIEGSVRAWPGTWLITKERRTDHGRVFAQHVGVRHGKVGLIERVDHAILAFDRVRRLHQHSGRFPTQHVVARRRGEEVGRVRLAAFELFDGQGSFETLDVCAQIFGKPGFVESMRVFNVDGVAGGNGLCHQLILECQQCQRAHPAATPTGFIITVCRCLYRSAGPCRAARSCACRRG